MKTVLNNFVIFAVGAAVGAAATCKFFRDKYEQIADEKINSLKELYNRKYSEIEEHPEDESYSDDQIAIEEYRNTIQEEGYANYAESKVVNNVEKPYVIKPEEFGEMDDYDTVSLTYYSDEVLTSDRDDRVEDVENTVGLDFASHFGEYEDDSVFIRNDRLKTDYEILIDLRNYSDVVKKIPHHAEE